MVRHVLGFLLGCLLISCCVSGQAAPPMVVDDAKLYSQSEIEQMEKMISEIRETYQMDAAVWTTYSIPDSHGDDSVTVAWADRYYEEQGYGLGSDRAGVVFVLDMTNRYNYLSDAGTMADYLTDHRIEELLSAADDDLELGFYGDAMIAQLRKLTRFLKEGIEEGQFRYDAETGERLTGLYNRLTGSELFLAVSAGLGTALCFYLLVMSRYHLRGSTYRYDRSNMKVKLVRDDEQFLREKVTRIRNASSSGGPSRGGGRGGGLGSGMHRSSGGMSHGGGGHHF